MSISTSGSYNVSSTSFRLAIILDASVRTLSQLPCLIALSRRQHLRCHFLITTSWGVQQCSFLPSTLNFLLAVMVSSVFGRIARWSNHFIIRMLNLSRSVCIAGCSLLSCSKLSISLSICSLGIVSITLTQKLLTWSWFLKSICFGLLCTGGTSSRLSAMPGSYSMTSNRWSLVPTCSSCKIPIRVMALDWIRHCDTIIWSMWELPAWAFTDSWRVHAFLSGCKAPHADVSDLTSHRELKSLDSFFSIASIPPFRPCSFHGMLKSPARMILTLSPNLSTASITSRRATSRGSRVSCVSWRIACCAFQEVLCAHGI